jgi:glycosyltransferase involved in cell wall biosynthesis
MRVTLCAEPSIWPQLTSGFDGFSARYREWMAELSRRATVSLVVLGDLSDQAMAALREALGADVPVFATPGPFAGQTTLRRAFRALRVFAAAQSSPTPRAYRNAVRETEPDVLILFGLGRQSLRLSGVMDLAPVVIVAEEDTSVLPGFERAQSRLGKALFAIEDRVFHKRVRRPRTVIVISDHEIEWATTYFQPGQVVVAPHMIDVDYWSSTSPCMERSGLLAVGHFGIPRNSQGLVAVARALAAHPGWSDRISVISATPPPMDALPDFVDYVGPVPDPREMYRTARLCLVPAFDVSGVKTTILQGWAAGCPVAATGPAARTVGGLHEFDLVLGESAEDLADQIVRALGDDDRLASLAANGRSSLARYSATRSRQAFVEALTGTVDGR